MTIINLKHTKNLFPTDSPQTGFSDTPSPPTPGRGVITVLLTSFGKEGKGWERAPWTYWNRYVHEVGREPRIFCCRARFGSPGEGQLQQMRASQNNFRGPE
jgi:hypothetical protein